jgi:hypothetical protein
MLSRVYIPILIMYINHVGGPTIAKKAKLATGTEEVEKVPGRF